jgi:hypothetical protein
LRILDLARGLFFGSPPGRCRGSRGWGGGKDRNFPPWRFSGFLRSSLYFDIFSDIEQTSFKPAIPDPRENSTTPLVERSRATTIHKRGRAPIPRGDSSRARTPAMVIPEGDGADIHGFFPRSPQGLLRARCQACEPISCPNMAGYPTQWTRGPTFRGDQRAPKRASTPSITREDREDA